MFVWIIGIVLVLWIVPASFFVLSACMQSSRLSRTEGPQDVITEH
jgi:hypothetical protein